MKLIVITSPTPMDGEAILITELFKAGLEILHLRKPHCTKEIYENILRDIPAEYLDRIVVHDFFDLVESYGLKGIHLNSRNPEIPVNFKGKHVSRSCHTLSEVERYKPSCNYLFLSPIYNSISKADYKSGFCRNDLIQARESGIIDQQVIALGGIHREKIAEVESLGFGGVACLGNIWQGYPKQVVSNYISLKKEIDKTEPQKPPIVLSIAGSDSSAGAGIQADLKTISALGGYAATVITAITAQNTLGVQSASPVDAEMVRQQMEAVLNDLDVEVVKIGMIPNAAVAKVIAETLSKYHVAKVVYDPVMSSTSGYKLMEENVWKVLFDHTSNSCKIILTPNLVEASRLLDRPVETLEVMREAAIDLSIRYYPTSILLKGGHLQENELVDILAFNGEMKEFPHSKINSSNLHGTGCTLSSAIATYWAKGYEEEEMIVAAQCYLTKAIEQAKREKIGHGNGPLAHFHHFFR